MNNSEPLRRRIARTRFAPVAALPLRLQRVARHNGRSLARSARWLIRSREHTNYTYDLTPLNREHLAWFAADVAGVDVAETRGYLDELDNDMTLKEHIQWATMNSDRRWLADRDVRYGRRAGWYAIVRAVRPAHVVETGTDKGLGSCVLAAALMRNGSGTLTTLDVNPDSGYLIRPPYSDVVEKRVGNSLDELGGLGSVDLFLHDSLHTAGHESAEFAAVEPHLSESALVMSDNCSLTDALPRFAERTGRRFLFFDERPEGHWFPGEGIGVAVQRST